MQGGGDSDGSSYYEDSEDDPSWIPWFCGLKGNEFFCEVEEEYIQDEFNLYGLSSQVEYYEHALDMILDVDSGEGLTPEQEEAVETSAEILFGLIHSRYILTTRGLHAMKEKYKAGDFGRCPRVYCQGQHVLPIGLSDIPGQSTIKLFCPRCEDVYYPRSSRHNGLDGAFFGRTCAHLFFQQFPELIPPKPADHYVPRIFGFRLHRSAMLHPPEDAEEKEKEKEKKGDGGDGSAGASKDVVKPLASPKRRAPSGGGSRERRRK
eukprot:TRINITY_DN2079_c0_g1_i2.p1 TRINITY_DN2079_c0_g1~~TRINITY_DN2079_c0_g1_i2.p1  ORF type:complete len:263 (-),score=59.99 TRINITY_DN2079_c0_g1_i2:282-1070(-)